MIGAIILIVAMVLSFVWLWVGGIEYMKKNHPEYKGEDFLNWGKDDDDKDHIS
jgi:hypothetical protein